MFTEPVLYEIFESLNDLYCNLLKQKQTEKALLIWQALWLAVKRDFLPLELSKRFITKTTPLVKNLLDPIILGQVIDWCEAVIEQQPISLDTSELELYIAEFKQSKLRVIGSSTPLQEEAFAGFDFNVDQLHHFTSSYQIAQRLSKINPSQDNQQQVKKAAQKITNLEVDVLSQAALIAWKTYLRVIEENPGKEDYLNALAWLRNLLIRHDNYGQAIPKSPDWQCYREALQSIREELCQALPVLPAVHEKSIEQIVTAQRTYNTKLRRFLAEIAADCEKVLGPAPCVYAVVGVGSISRDEAAQYSDLEFILMVEPYTAIKPLVHAYFDAWLQLFDFKIRSLGEIALRGNGKGLMIDSGYSPKFNFDRGVNPNLAASPFTFGTPAEIIKSNFKTLGNQDIGSEYKRATLVSAELFSFLHSAYIGGNSLPSPYISSPWTSASLFKDFQIQLDQQLKALITLDNKINNLSMRKAVGMMQLMSHRADLEKKLVNVIDTMSVVAIKETYLNLISCIGFALAYYYDLPMLKGVNAIQHSLDIWQALQKNGIIDLATFHFLRRGFANCSAIRILAQKHYQQQLKPELVATSAKARKTALTWEAPSGWWGHGLEGEKDHYYKPPSLIEQLKFIVPHPDIDSIYDLHPDCYFDLASFEWLFLRPLLLVLKGKESMQPLLLQQLNPLRDTFDALFNQVLANPGSLSIAEFSKYLISYLIYTNATPEIYYHFYERLNEEGQRQFAMHLHELNLKELAPITHELIHRAKPDGWRPLRDIQRKAWCKVVKTLFHPVYDEAAVLEAGLPLIKTRNLDNPASTACQTYQLTKKAYSQLFDQGNFKARSAKQQDGRHTALTVVTKDERQQEHRVFWKLSPEQPAAEALDEELTWLLTGEAHPNTLVLKVIRKEVTTGKLQTEIVQLVEGVTGITLSAQDIKQHAAMLGQIDKASFTRHFLSVLISNPEDDNGCDYFLTHAPGGNTTQSLSLKRIDRERKYYQPDETQKTYIGFSSKKILLVKSILYCLNQTQEPLDNATLMAFAKLNTEQVLRRWLHFAKTEEQFYRNLFTPEEVKEHFNRRDVDMTLLAVFLPQGLIRSIWSRIEAAQSLIKLAQASSGSSKTSTSQIEPTLTGMQLLKEIQGTLASYYLPAFDRFPYDANRPELAEERFKFVTAGTGAYLLTADNRRQTNTLALIAITKNSNFFKQRPAQKLTVDDALAMYRGERESAQTAVSELKTMRKVDSLRLAEMLLTNVPNSLQQFKLLAANQQVVIITHLFKLANQASYALKQETLETVLELLASGIVFPVLDLSAFRHVLQDSHLLALLKSTGQALDALNLSQCLHVTEKGIEGIEKYCPGLKALSLSQCTQLKTVTLHLKQLTSLNIADCHQLKKINAQLPELTHINVEECVELEEIVTGAKKSAEINIKIKGCLKLQKIEGIPVASEQEAQKQEVFLQPITLIEKNLSWLLAEIIQQEPQFKYEIKQDDNKLTLKLSRSSLLTNELLITVLGNLPSTLMSLSLKECTNLSGRIIPDIAQKCPQLETLHLSHLNVHYLVFAEASNLFLASFFTLFRSLKTLTITHCPQIKEIRLCANELRSITIRNNPNLRKILLKAARLQSLGIADCHMLQEIISDSRELTSTTINRCNQLTNLYLKDNRLNQLIIENCPLISIETIKTIIDHSPGLENFSCTRNAFPIPLRLYRKNPVLLTLSWKRIPKDVSNILCRIIMEKSQRIPVHTTDFVSWLEKELNLYADYLHAVTKQFQKNAVSFSLEEKEVQFVNPPSVKKERIKPEVEEKLCSDLEDCAFITTTDLNTAVEFSLLINAIIKFEEQLPYSFEAAVHKYITVHYHKGIPLLHYKYVNFHQPSFEQSMNFYISCFETICEHDQSFLSSKRQYIQYRDTYNKLKTRVDARTDLILSNIIKDYEKHGFDRHQVAQQIEEKRCTLAYHKILFWGIPTKEDVATPRIVGILEKKLALSDKATVRRVILRCLAKVQPKKINNTTYNLVLNVLTNSGENNFDFIDAAKILVSIEELNVNVSPQLIESLVKKYVNILYSRLGRDDSDIVHHALIKMALSSVGAKSSHTMDQLLLEYILKMQTSWRHKRDPVISFLEATLCKYLLDPFNYWKKKLATFNAVENKSSLQTIVKDSRPSLSFTP
ncbi:hypothetical protein [Legionella clemsonensis]|uniref:Protein-PII uridylyltransferase N-terminal domain-containing protein n=1 Tax=Legionella clemsonensis TaxID=1867846 RepID=A0A222P4Q5_9GAMM|nr:hypothetical protein [Legionella clemsonensis]ASQ46765.1 hypothetical protein clem_11095 [Legionella clemsonensis]